MKASRQSSRDIHNLKMIVITSISLITVAFGIYWYMNRHKKLKYMLRDLRVALDMQGAGGGGLIDDWVSVWSNKVELPDAKNKIALITGGGKGIGLEVIRGLLKANMTVIMGVRNPESVKKVIQTLENGDKVRMFPLDLTSLKSVKKFSEDVLKEFSEIHLLINNAGIMFVDYTLTEDGFELQFAVNHLSHFYLTHLLLPALKIGGQINGPSRIVNVSSCAHFPGEIYFDDINMKEHYNTTAAYAQSKLAQVMIARYINRMLEEKELPVKCYSVHPGIVDTDLFQNTNYKNLPSIRKILFKTPEKGAISVLYTSFNEDILARGGLYIANCKEGFTNRFSKNKNHQEKLFKLSCDMVGIDAEKFGHV